MKPSIIEESDYIALVDLDSSEDPKKRNVLAAMTDYDGEDLWQLTDVRLSRYRMPSPYFGGLIADDLRATIMPTSDEHSEFVRSRLREFIEGQDGRLHWCTFDGIVRNEASTEKPRWVKLDQAGFFTKEEGLLRLREMQEFWVNFDGDPATVKILNPHSQPSESALNAEWFALMWCNEHAAPGL